MSPSLPQWMPIRLAQFLLPEASFSQWLEVKVERHFEENLERLRTSDSPLDRRSAQLGRLYKLQAQCHSVVVAEDIEIVKRTRLPSVDNDHDPFESYLTEDDDESADEVPEIPGIWDDNSIWRFRTHREAELLCYPETIAKKGQEEPGKPGLNMFATPEALRLKKAAKVKATTTPVNVMLRKSIGMSHDTFINPRHHIHTYDQSAFRIDRERYYQGDRPKYTLRSITLVDEIATASFVNKDPDVAAQMLKEDKPIAYVRPWLGADDAHKNLVPDHFGYIRFKKQWPGY